MRLFSLSLFLFVSVFVHAQAVTANDSAVLGAGTTQMVFYQLSTGNKTVVSNTDWHLAITVRATQFPNAPLGGTTIRINEANGVNAIYVPNADAASFNSVDTTGWQAWTRLHDSDTAIDEGALNSNRSSNIFDFGWGVYNSSSHNVVGDSLYLIQLPNGGLKKFMVVQLVKDTAFEIKYANIDNSDLQTVYISKKNYAGKQFVYLNLLTNAVHDKEPLAANWDLLFLKYAANDVQPDTAYPVAGVWVNKNASVAKAEGVNVNSNNYAGYSFSNRLNTIGWNWKEFNMQTFAYDVQDSLVYFVKTQAGLYYKVIFTGYSGGGSGIVRFYAEALSSASGLYDADRTGSIQLYPNPAQQIVVVETETPASVLTITDVSGRVVLSKPLLDTTEVLDVSALPNGMYAAVLSTNGKIASKTFVVNR
ncbi:MAG: T9SS type A sorting domain-containing protein [Chitinophagales bacterium]|nr:T9SS type A sorting domain-containing protein [Chitinophagales bacterium]